MSTEIDKNMIAGLDTVGRVIIKDPTMKVTDQFEETPILADGPVLGKSRFFLER